MKPTIAIALGDPTGIGPEVSLKSLAALGDSAGAAFVLIGDKARCLDLNDRLGTRLPLRDLGEGAGDGPFRILNVPLAGAGELRAGAPEAARCAMSALEEGARRCLRGEFAALVTAPVNKEAIVRAGYPAFVGQTEHLSALARTSRTVMMLLGQDDRDRWLRVALATTHVSLRRVADEVTREKVELAIERAAGACADLGVSRARIAVCGLNPHAGEGGHLGTEEQTVIGPAVAAMARRGFDVTGPASADALFHYVYRGDYDAVVAMYHDQGLAPLKMVAFDRGINWTLGLPFVRTSPDHGTAYDIAGQGKAGASSMTAAIRLAAQLARRRAG